VSKTDKIDIITQNTNQNYRDNLEIVMLFVAIFLIIVATIGTTGNIETIKLDDNSIDKA